MHSSLSAGAKGLDAMQTVKWSSAEKAVARTAFDRALKRELDAVIDEVKKRSAKIRQPSDLWDLERYLTKSRTQIDRRFDYRYSVLMLVFGDSIRDGRLASPRSESTTRPSSVTVKSSMNSCTARRSSGLTAANSSRRKQSAPWDLALTNDA